jgi:hypothetical protein
VGQLLDNNLGGTVSLPDNVHLTRLLKF